MRWAKILAGVVGVLFVAVIGVIIFLATLDLNNYKAEIQDAVKQATGRDLVLDGDLSLTWTPRPAVTTSNARFANAPWGSEPDMVSVGTLDVAVNVAPLLSGKIEADRIALSDVAILLERNAQGEGNWEMGQPTEGQSRAGGPPKDLPFLGSVELNNVAILWKEAPQAEPVQIEIDTLVLEAEGPSAPLSIELGARLDGEDVRLDGILPALSEAQRPGAVLPIELEGEVAGQEIRFAANLRYAVDGGGALTSLQAERVEVSVDDLAVTGGANVDLGGERPKLDLEIASDRIVLPQGEDSAEEAGTDPLEQPLPVDLLTVADATVSVTVGTLEAGKLEVTDVAAQATLAAGVLTLDPLSAVLSDGAVSAKAVVDGSGETARLALAGQWTGADFGALVTTLQGSDMLSAKGDVAVDLRGSGATGRDVLNTADGFAYFVAREGRIDNEYWEFIAEDLTSRFLPFTESGEDRGNLTCAVGRWSIERGVAETVVLMVDSSRVTIAGDGTIDLARESLDMKLTPRPKDPALVSLATPILVTGPIAGPTIAPDPLAVAKGVGTAVVGTMINPLSLVLPFVSGGSDETPCPDAIAIAEGRKAMPTSGGGGAASPTPEQQEKPGGIRGLFDSLRKKVE